MVVIGTAPVAALSCLRVDPAAAFEGAAQADESFIVVVGAFDFDPADLPQSHADGVRSAQFPAQFTGDGLNRDGFTVPLSITVTLDVECLGPWCGALTPGAPHLAFLERADTGFRLTVGACPGTVFADPDAATLDQMLTCLEGDCQAG